MSEWISVDQELPPNSAYVLALHIYGHMHVVRLDREEEFGWFNDDAQWQTEGWFTHWMPLPDPPAPPAPKA